MYYLTHSLLFYKLIYWSVKFSDLKICFVEIETNMNIQPDIKVLGTLSSIKVFSSLDYSPLPKFIRCGQEEFFWLKGLSEKCGKRSLESRLSRRILFYRPFQTLWNVRCPKLHIFNTTSYPPHKLGCIECAFNKESFLNFATFLPSTLKKRTPACIDRLELSLTKISKWTL